MFRVTHSPYFAPGLIFLLGSPLSSSDSGSPGFKRRKFALVNVSVLLKARLGTGVLAGGQPGLHWEVGDWVPLHN